MVRLAPSAASGAGNEDVASLHGVVVIDKPIGPTSHDVVARVRRILGTRAVGHAGTLDPAASGVLVVAVGQATKLVSYLTSQAKHYQATLTFGSSTTTLDREGDVTATAPIPSGLADELRGLALQDRPPLHPESGSSLERALEIERRRTEQVPPAFSAIKQNGRAVYQRARRGEPVKLAARAVHVLDLEVTGASADSLGLALSVSKGFYVRALARDLGETLQVPAHLSSLRRVSSGPFTLEEALPNDATREALLGGVEPLARVVARVLPVCRLSAEGRERARRGQTLGPEHFVLPPVDRLSAWLDSAGELVAIGRREDARRFDSGRESGSAGADCFAVERGFSYSTSTAAT
jgi:tRNA pseudouridine55 synthase